MQRQIPHPRRQRSRITAAVRPDLPPRGLRPPGFLFRWGCATAHRSMTMTAAPRPGAAVAHRRPVRSSVRHARPGGADGNSSDQRPATAGSRRRSRSATRAPGDAFATLTDSTTWRSCRARDRRSRRHRPLLAAWPAPAGAPDPRLGHGRRGRSVRSPSRSGRLAAWPCSTSKACRRATSSPDEQLAEIAEAPPSRGHRAHAAAVSRADPRRSGRAARRARSRPAASWPPSRPRRPTPSASVRSPPRPARTSSSSSPRSPRARHRSPAARASTSAASAPRCRSRSSSATPSRSRRRWS